MLAKVFIIILILIILFFVLIQLNIKRFEVETQKSINKIFDSVKSFILAPIVFIGEFFSKDDQTPKDTD
jgi:hypothetical protein